MAGTPSATAFDAIGTFLAAQAFPVYVATLIAFAFLELALSRPGSRPVSPAGRYVVNFGLPIIGGLLMMALPLGSAGAALFAGAKGWGLFNRIDAPALLILSVALIARTLLSYWMHRAMHAVPLLWRIHRVHHTDPALDISTSLRHHPLELVLGVVPLLGLVMALGLPVWAALLADAVMLAGSLFKHLDIELPPRVERVLGRVLATPAIHRFHHSDRVAETDSNFGNLVIVWDFVFRTYTDPRGARPQRLGLGARFDGGAHDLWQQLRIGVADPHPPAKPRPRSDG